MAIIVDIRFLLPPVVNFCLQWLISSGENSSNTTMTSLPQFLLVLAFSLLFLAVPIKVPINFSVTAPTIGLQFSSDDVLFSGLLGGTLLASFLFTPSYFWLVYLICLSIAPWSAWFLAALKSCFQGIPIFVVMTGARWNYLAAMFAEAITAREQLVNQPGAGAADLPQVHQLQIDPVNFAEAEDEEYSQLQQVQLQIDPDNFAEAGVEEYGQLHGHA